QLSERPVVDLHGDLGLGLVHHHRQGVVGVTGIVDDAFVRFVVVESCRERCHGITVGEIDLQRREMLLRIVPGQRPNGRLRGIGGRTIRKSYVTAGRRKRLDNGGAQAASAAGDEHAAYALRWRHQAGSRAITSETFWPPKPNELEMTLRIRASRATFGTTSSGMVGSGTW